MDNKKIELGRKGMYQLLSRVFISELDLDTLKNIIKLLKNIDIPYTLKLRKIFKESDVEELYLKLRLDYTKTFLLYVHPYESVFLDESGLLCTEMSISVREIYREAGYEPSLGEAGVKCFDHIGIELGFMARLIEDENFSIQYKFLSNHLVKWAPHLGIVICEVALTEFYKKFGDILARFILDDYAYLRGVWNGG